MRMTGFLPRRFPNAVQPCQKCWLRPRSTKIRLSPAPAWALALPDGVCRVRLPAGQIKVNIGSAKPTIHGTVNTLKLLAEPNASNRPAFLKVGSAMKKYKINRIQGDALLDLYIGDVWASTPRNALNIVGTKRYGAGRFVIVQDDTVIGGHIRNHDGTECIEIH